MQGVELQVLAETIKHVLPPKEAHHGDKFRSAASVVRGFHADDQLRSSVRVFACVRVCVRVCVRACARARVCVHLRMRVWTSACACACA